MSLALAAACAAALWVAAWRDLRSFVIPNAVSIALVALFLARLPMLEAGEAGARALAGLICFALCFALFATGRFGAGDAKLLSAFLPHVDPALWGAFLIALALSGAGMLGLLGALRRWGAPLAPLAGEAARWRVWRVRRRAPYGFAIAAAGVFILALEQIIAALRG